jgi:tripartite-type tricarboxylate transporter receptor subunit TctC
MNPFIFAGVCSKKGDKMERKFVIALITVLLSMPAVNAYPQDYPVKPVTLMVAWPPGGGTDVGARIVASIAEKELGKPIVILNKPGAGGQIGFTELARQKSDGYYIGFINLPSLNTIILDPDRKATFGIDSFTPIINQVLDLGVIYAKPDGPYKSLTDVIQEARKRPGEVRAATTGILSDDHMAILMLEEAAKVRFRIVHFEGDPPLIAALLGGQIDVGFMNISGLVPRVRAGQLRALVVMDKERSKFYPDLPTSVELGYSTVISSSARGIAGPKGIPEPISKKLQAVFKKAMEDPEHIEKMEKAGLAVKIMMGDEYGRYIFDLQERMKPRVEDSRRNR